MTSTLPTGKHINLQLGWPSPTLFPSADLNAGANAVLTDFAAASAALVYGPDRGHIPLRSNLARWLSSTYYGNPDAVNESRICIAGGASQNLANVLLKFTDPTYTRRVWMVEPTYFLACPVFEDCGFVGKLRGVPEDDEGIDLEFLRKGLEEAEEEVKKSGTANAPQIKTPEAGYEKIYKHIIYVVPTFSNPSGKTMSLEHRYELVKLAIEYDALIVSDDVYDFLYWPMKRSVAKFTSEVVLPPRLVDINRMLEPDSRWGNTISNGSFSKIIAPGVRVSWAECTEAFAAKLAKAGSTCSGGNPGHLSSTFVDKMLSSGALDKHIKGTLIPTYSARYYTMVDAIKTHLEPLGVHISSGKSYSSSAEVPNGSNFAKANNSENDISEVQIAGGFFLCIALPDGLPPVPILLKTALAQYDLKFAYGQMFEVRGDAGSTERAKTSFGNTIRLCWAFHEEDAIADGIIRLRDIIMEGLNM